jgi:hypothetical protein
VFKTFQQALLVPLLLSFFSCSFVNTWMSSSGLNGWSVRKLGERKKPQLLSGEQPATVTETNKNKQRERNEIQTIEKKKKKKKNLELRSGAERAL